MATALILGAQSQAEASEFTGKIQALRYNAGSSGTRVSILVGDHRSPCNSARDWFAFENANQGLGALWTSALIEALTQAQTVVISGTGRCDSFGVEAVNQVEVR
jgi:hypothetical protein